MGDAAGGKGKDGRDEKILKDHEETVYMDCMNPVSWNREPLFPLEVWGSITRYLEDARDLIALFCTCTHTQAVERLSFFAAPDLSLRRWLRQYGISVDRFFKRVMAIQADGFFKDVS